MVTSSWTRVSWTDTSARRAVRRVATKDPNLKAKTTLEGGVTSMSNLSVASRKSHFQPSVEMGMKNVDRNTDKRNKQRFGSEKRVMMP